MFGHINAEGPRLQVHPRDVLDATPPQAFDDTRITLRSRDAGDGFGSEQCGFLAGLWVPAANAAIEPDDTFDQKTFGAVPDSDARSPIDCGALLPRCEDGLTGFVEQCEDEEVLRSELLLAAENCDRGGELVGAEGV